MSGGNYVVLKPEGRLDAAGARPFEAEWKEHLASGNTRILIDLTDVQYISSSGLRSLLAASRNTERAGGKTKLCCLSTRITEIFEMAGFDRVFEIYSSRREAEISFSE
jgi:anti-sigma B factor antagonist